MCRFICARAGAAGLCAALLLLALPGRLPAQPPEGPPTEKGFAETVEELHGKVSLALNTGGHTEPIYQMRFTPDGKKLITAWGAGVRVWDVSMSTEGQQAGGQPEQVWRLPGGNGHLAVSPDGKTVATAGPIQGQKGNVAVWLLPLETTGPPQPAPEVIRLPLPAKFPTHALSALAFSPDGSRLACGAGYWVHVYDLKAKVVTHSIQPQAGFAPRDARTTIARLQFSKDGNRLLVGLGDIYSSGHGPQVWDVRRPAKPSPEPEQPAAPLFGLKGAHEPWAAWSADNEQFAVLRAWWAHDIALWSADGTPQPRKFDQRRLQAEFGTEWWGPNGDIHFLPDGRLVAGVGGGRSGTVLLLDPQTGKVERLHHGATQDPWFFTTAVSPDGNMLAVTGDPGSQVILKDVKTKKEVIRLGPSSKVPRLVGWGKDSRSIAWGVEWQPEGKPRVTALTAGLNLATLEPLRDEERKDLRGGEWNPDNWKIFRADDAHRKDKSYGVVLVKPDGERIETPIRGLLTPAWTWYKDSKDQQDRIAICMNRDVYLYDPKTNKVLHTLEHPGPTRVTDVAVTPDGKYLLVACGQQFVQLFHIEGKPQRLLNILAVGEDWVAWTPEGYYAATPGGERLIGWQIKHDDSTPLDFYPVERFRKLFYKPEVIQKLLETGSVEEALKATRTRGAAVEDALPPTVRITKVVAIKEGGKARLQVTAEATAGARDQPVESLRLLLDGRAHPDARPVEIKAGAAARAVWLIEPLPGRHELKVLARCQDVAGVSEARPLSEPLADKDRPVLHRVCVGINAYDQKGLHLGAAAADAEAVFKALKECCTGARNRFRPDKGALLLDGKADRKAVLDSLKDVRKQGAKPGDLLVVFFAGHGVVQGGEFFLLTREADTGKPLAGRSLSGKDLQEAFAEMPCSVLLLMDACHSAAGVPLLRLKPATDDLTRSLTDDQVAVTVLAAAMGYETAGERPGHGLFTQALLEGLQAGKDVPFDRHDHQLYVHHLYSHVFSEVRKASAGRQNPFLNMPWTVPPLALREVPAK